MKPCDFCGDDFTPKRRDMRFCSRDCRARGIAREARIERRASASVKPCAVCGEPFAKTHHAMRFCSKVCWSRARNDARQVIPTEKRCGQCDVDFQPMRCDQTYCSATCRRRARTARAPKVGISHRFGPRPTMINATCRVCGTSFPCTRRDARFCSQLCYTRDENRRVDGHMRRARRRGAFVARVIKQDICVRDDWTCQLCGWYVLREDRYPHPMSASLDHIVPLSKGGTHEPDNVQLAHLRCNIRKGNRLELVA